MILIIKYKMVVKGIYMKSCKIINENGKSFVECCNCKKENAISPSNTRHNRDVVQGCEKVFICPECEHECCIDLSKLAPKLTPVKQKSKIKPSRF